MSDHINQLERQVDQELARLFAQAPEWPLPDPAATRQAVAAVRAEAARLKARRRARPWLHGSAAFAASVVLLLVLPPRIEPPIPVVLAEPNSPAERVDDWLDALDESSERLTLLLTEQGDQAETPAPAPSPEDRIEDWLDSLDASLNLGA